MTPELLEKHEPLVLEIANAYLDNMELELGKKYVNNGYQIDAGLSDAQYNELRTKYNLTSVEFAELYTEFQRMKPTTHMKKALDAFTASGGNVEIEPDYDESTQRLGVQIRFVIKDQSLNKIEGLSPVEDVILKMNAMLQIDTVLSGSDPDVSPSF